MLNPDWFPFLTDKHFNKLEKFISDEPINFMAHQLAVIIGIDWASGISIISVLHAKNIIDVELLIYHKCDEFEMPVGSYQFGKGFPPLPWYCEECDTEVENYSDLDFDLLAVIRK